MKFDCHRRQCVMDEPYSPNCCKRCTEKRIACLPHEGKRKSRQAASNRERSVASSDSEPDANRVEVRLDKIKLGCSGLDC